MWLWSFVQFEAWTTLLNPSAFGHIDLTLILITYICFSLLVLTGLDLRLCFPSYGRAFLKCLSAHESSCSCENPCVNAIMDLRSHAQWYNMSPKESEEGVIWQPKKKENLNCAFYICLSK